MTALASAAGANKVRRAALTANLANSLFAFIHVNALALPSNSVIRTQSVHDAVHR